MPIHGINTELNASLDSKSYVLTNGFISRRLPYLFKTSERRRDRAYNYSHGSTPRLNDIDAEGDFDDESDDERPVHYPRAGSLDYDSEEESYYRHQHSYSHRPRYDKYNGHPYAYPRPPPPVHTQTNGVSSYRSPVTAGQSASGKFSLRPYAYPPSHSRPSPQDHRGARGDDMHDVSMDEDDDLEGDVEMNMNGNEETARDGHSHHRSRVPAPSYSHSRSQQPIQQSRLADLDSSGGRLAFISSSVQHLFRTTYEYADELSIGALVNYLNAAMPADKHEDFDVQEVTRAAASLAKSGVLIQEGDRLRPAQ